jgi:hypothetical protein
LLAVCPVLWIPGVVPPPVWLCEAACVVVFLFVADEFADVLLV